ncbi:MAG: hypothetical protein ACLF0G_07990 [Candidatus Brocadiia bacterium]
MTMRERMMAVLEGREHDRVPFVQYSGLAAPDEQVWAEIGRARVGILRWTRAHRLEHPHCHVEHEDTVAECRSLRRTTLHTPEGSLVEERAFEGGYGSSCIRRHFVQEPADYKVLNAFLRDAVVADDTAAWRQVDAALGEDGLPLTAVERTPYQQLWVQWAGLENLAVHLAEQPQVVEETLELLAAQARQVFEVAARSPAPFVDFPDNITAPVVGAERFRRWCVPFYDDLAGMLGESGRRVFVHMDGDLRPLHTAIGQSRVGGIDSFSPCPDGDTRLAEARSAWPQMRLWANFPSSCHLRPYREVRAVAERLLEEDGRSGLLQLQVSENVPRQAWRTSYRAIAEAVEAFDR